MIGPVLSQISTRNPAMSIFRQTGGQAGERVISILRRLMGPERGYPTFRHIQIVEAIARHRSISQAAESLHVTQPVVTRALKQVEEILGVPLFDRTPYGVMPTVYAEPILKRAQSIQTAMRETERELSKLHTNDLNRVRIGAGIHSIEIWGNRALASLVLQNPDLKISLESYDWNDLIGDLVAGQIDYAISEISELTGRTDIAIEHLADLDLHFVCNVSHPLASGAVPDVAEICRYPMVGNKMVRRLAERFQHSIGRLGEYDHQTGGIHAAIRVPTLNAIKHVLTASDAVALMPLGSVHAELVARTLVALPRDAMPWLIGQIGFIAAASRHMTPPMTAFRKAVMAVEHNRRQALPAE